jgi:phage protein U
MSLGSLGSIIFEVSYTDDQLKVFTFDGLKRSNKIRIGKHEVIGAKPITEIIGPDLGEVKFTMLLSASLGINPLQAMTDIYTAFNAGTPMTLMLGQYVIGNYQWIISDIGEDYDKIDNRGNVWQMKIDISLQEYVASIGDPATTPTTTTTMTNSTTTTVPDSPDQSGITGDGDGGENPTLSGGEDEE